MVFIRRFSIPLGRYSLPLILCVSALSLSAAPFAAPSLVVDEHRGDYELGPYLEILEDPDRRWSIEQVAAPDFDGRFIPSSERVPNFGYTDSAYWVRFRVGRAGAAGTLWLLECGLPAMDSMILFERTERGWVSREAGDIFPFARREIEHRNVVLRLRLPADSPQPRQFYLRFATQGIVQMSLNLWNPEAFAEKVGNEQFGFGLYYGLLLAMVVYNLFLFFTVRDPGYLYYVIYIFSFALTVMSVNGLAFQYLWGRWPVWANLCVNFFMGLTTMSMALFTRDFLRTPARNPRLDFLIRVLIGFSVLFMFGSLFVSYRLGVRVGVGLTLVTCVLLFFGAVFSWQDGYRPARYFLLAWAGLFAGCVAFVLKNLNILPTLFITEYGLQFGSALEVMLLSLALGDRFNTLRREKNAATRALNESLEALVSLRTRELNHALTDLRQAHSELQARDSTIQRELDVAARIQRGILPPYDFSAGGLRVLSYYKSIEKVGGDFFDMEPLSGGRLGVVIADVSGHGIPAALLTTMAKIAFSEAVRSYTSPAAILENINSTIGRTVKTEEFLTAFCCIIDRDLRLTYSSAGHHHGFLLRRPEGEATRLETPGIVLGLGDEMAIPFVDKFETMRPGDRLFLFTDGIVEATDRTGDVFGRRRLYETLIASLNLDLTGQRDFLLKHWENFTGETPPEDDASFLLLEANESASV